MSKKNDYSKILDSLCVNADGWSITYFVLLIFFTLIVMAGNISWPYLFTKAIEFNDAEAGKNRQNEIFDNNAYMFIFYAMSAFAVSRCGYWIKTHLCTLLSNRIAKSSTNEINQHTTQLSLEDHLEILNHGVSYQSNRGHIEEFFQNLFVYFPSIVEIIAECGVISYYYDFEVLFTGTILGTTAGTAILSQLITHYMVRRRIETAFEAGNRVDHEIRETTNNYFVRKLNSRHDNQRLQDELNSAAKKYSRAKAIQNSTFFVQMGALTFAFSALMLYTSYSMQKPNESNNSNESSNSDGYSTDDMTFLINYLMAIGLNMFYLNESSRRFNDALAGLSSMNLLRAKKIEDINSGNEFPNRPNISIQLERVSIRDEQGYYLVRNFHYQLEEHSMNAIVGRSGAGKSSLSKILMGFYNKQMTKVYSGVSTEMGQPFHFTKAATQLSDWCNIGRNKRLGISEALNRATAEQQQYIKHDIYRAYSEGFISNLPHSWTSTHTQFTNKEADIQELEFKAQEKSDALLALNPKHATFSSDVKILTHELAQIKRAISREQQRLAEIKEELLTCCCTNEALLEYAAAVRKNLPIWPHTLALYAKSENKKICVWRKNDIYITDFELISQSCDGNFDPQTLHLLAADHNQSSEPLYSVLNIAQAQNSVNYTGKITINGIDIADIKKIKLRENMITSCEAPHSDSSQDIIEYLTANLPQSAQEKNTDEMRTIAQEKLRVVGLVHKKITDKVNTLSSGEAQRLLFARCLIKSQLTDAKIFLFDEITSAQDPVNQVELMKLTKELQDTGATILFITHRLSTVKDADQIAYLTVNESFGNKKFSYLADATHVGTHADLYITCDGYRYFYNCDTGIAPSGDRDPDHTYSDITLREILIDLLDASSDDDDEADDSMDEESSHSGAGKQEVRSNRDGFGFTGEQDDSEDDFDTELTPLVDQYSSNNPKIPPSFLSSARHPRLPIPQKKVSTLGIQIDEGSSHSGAGKREVRSNRGGFGF